MPLASFKIPPGVVKTDSNMAATGRWIDTEKMRFVRGFPEKIGGIQKLDEDSFTGIARGAQGWATFAGVQCLAFGTACRLYLLRAGTISNISPFRVTGISLTDPFETTNGSAVVTVTDTAHGIEDTSVVASFSGASAVGGITIDGEYQITSIIDADSYTITHSSAASSDATGGGSVTAAYTLNCGNVDPTYLLGWGVGGWGTGYWGTPASLASAVISDPLCWSMDVYGEDLIVNPLDGTIYLYDASAGIVRAAAITNAPAACRYAFVTPERYIMALGCTKIAGGQDTMTVRWPDVDDNTDWTPSSTNTANERKLQGGSRLIAGTGLAGGVSLVWSDTSLFVFQFTGSNEVYASRQEATECGLYGPQAWAKASGMAFWMGRGNFWMYAGGVQPIPNVEDIRSWVFDRLNVEHAFKSVAFYNPLFNEVWFLFPSGTATEPDTYVFVDLDDFSWANGTLTRSAATRYTTGESRPIMFGTDGYIYVHDVMENPDNDGSAMEAYIELAPTQVQNGNTHVDIFNMVPDFARQAGDVEVYLYGRDHPRDSDFMTDTVTIGETDKLVDTRVSGRQFGLKFTTNEIGGDFRLGVFQLDISKSGARI